MRPAVFTDLDTRLDSRIRLLPAVGLDVAKQVALATRFERKHLVPTRWLADVIDLVAGRVSVLEVDGARQVHYANVYFDTSELSTFHAHRQRRRRRFKVRTRSYGDAATAMLEVKAKGARGETVKLRRPHPGAAVTELGAQAVTFVDASLQALYGLEAPADLLASVETRYLRTTLIDVVGGERLTIDRALSVSLPGGSPITFDPDLAIVESKSVARHTLTRGALCLPGARPGRLSKYCLGVAALHPHIHASEWRPALRRLRRSARRVSTVPAPASPP